MIAFLHGRVQTSCPSVSFPHSCTIQSLYVCCHYYYARRCSWKMKVPSRE